MWHSTPAEYVGEMRNCGIVARTSHIPILMGTFGEKHTNVGQTRDPHTTISSILISSPTRVDVIHIIHIMILLKLTSYASGKRTGEVEYTPRNVGFGEAHLGDGYELKIPKWQSSYFYKKIISELHAPHIAPIHSTWPSPSWVVRTAARQMFSTRLWWW